MTFQQLLQGAEVLSQSGNPAVAGVEYDSRRVRPGTVFVAMKGETSDGNRFIDQAIAAGAVAIVTDSAAETPRPAVALGASRAWTPRASPPEREFLQASCRANCEYWNYRHERKKHDRLPDRIHIPSGRTQDRAGRNHRVSRCREDSPSAAHHAGSAGIEPAFVGGPGPGSHRSGDGSVVARARAAACFRNSF